MAGLSSSKRRALLPQIDIHVARDGANDNDDNEEIGRLTLTRPASPSATTTARTSRSSLPAQGTTSVSVATSRTTPVGQASAVPLITPVTAPAQTTIVTMFVTVSANPVTVTVTPTEASAIPAAKTISPSTSEGVNDQAPEFDTTGTGGAPAVMTTTAAQMSSATISGPGAALIGGLGVAAGLSVIGVVAIILLRRKRQTKANQEKQSGFL